MPIALDFGRNSVPVSRLPSLPGIRPHYCKHRDLLSTWSSSVTQAEEAGVKKTQLAPWLSSCSAFNEGQAWEQGPLKAVPSQVSEDLAEVGRVGVAG